MYDLSITIPDAGSEKGYFTIHIDSFPRAKMAYDFLRNPPDTVKKNNTILVAMKGSSVFAFSYVDISGILEFVDGKNSESSFMLSVINTWKNKGDILLKMLLLSSTDIDTYILFVEFLEKATKDLKIDPAILEPLYNLDTGAARTQWSTKYTVLSSKERPIARAIHTVLGTSDYYNAMQSIVEAYGGRAPLDKYNKIFDKHISLMDYLLSRYTYDMIFASDA